MTLASRTMELLRGVDLQRLVRQFGPQEPGRTICLLEQVCEVLHEAHSHQLVHRDIKPANIFVTRQVDEGDFARVVDFGLVRAIGCDRHEATTPQNMSGSLAFIPPEVVTAECVGECDIDGRADIYALGCVAYWLLTGQLVFDSTTALAMAAAHAVTPPSPPSCASARPIPAGLDRCVLDCLAKDPSERPQSARELADRLGAIAGEEVAKQGLCRPEHSVRRKGSVARRTMGKGHVADRHSHQEGEHSDHDEALG